MLQFIFAFALGAVAATVFFLIKPNKFEKLHKEAMEEVDKLKRRV